MAIDSELIAQILYFASPVLSIIALWLSRNENIFNSRKIQKYDVWDYQYIVLLYQVIYSIFNPIIFMLGFFFANWVAPRLEINYYLQLVFMLEIYFAAIIIVLVIESEILSRKKERLRIISSSISEEFSKTVLNVDSKKHTIYKINMLFFSIVWLILIKQSNENIILGVAILWFIYYLISIILMPKRLSKYKTRAKMKSNTIIRMDYRKYYGCYCNIVLKKEFSFKIQDNNIVIYFPGDISSYTIKQDNLVSITVGYRVEYFDVKENQYTGTFINKK